MCPGFHSMLHCPIRRRGRPPYHCCSLCMGVDHHHPCRPQACSFARQPRVYDQHTGNIPCSRVCFRKLDGFYKGGEFRREDEDIGGGVEVEGRGQCCIEGDPRCWWVEWIKTVGGGGDVCLVFFCVYILQKKYKPLQNHTMYVTHPHTHTCVVV